MPRLNQQLKFRRFPALVHHFGPLVVAVVAWWDDDRHAASGCLHSRNTLGAKGLVAYVAKRARVSRQQIPGPLKGQESHAANGHREPGTAAGAAGHDEMWQ